MVSAGYRTRGWKEDETPTRIKRKAGEKISKEQVRLDQKDI